MSGHRNVGGAGMTQNQGNVLGDRPCVRQSKLSRQHDAGNAMKDLMGQSHLSWKGNVQEGAYAGMKVYDHGEQEQYKPPMMEQNVNKTESAQAKPVQQQQAARQPATGTRQNRDATFNFFTGEDK